ncbi:MAG: hypothetical protein NXH88_17595, partial [Hyphomonas sp.]|nr:hypothetical protein [Hyphomonas sp.]
ITKDLEEDDTLPALYRACEDLKGAFGHIKPDLIPTLCEMLRRGNYYSALCYLKQVIELEAQLLGQDNTGALAA